MSLESLINLRQTGMRPSWVWVLVGKVPTWYEDDEQTVIVKKPADFDFRALVGLNVSVIEVGDNGPLLDKVLKAVEASAPKTISVGGSAGYCGQGEKHELVLQKMRELLCNC